MAEPLPYSPQDEQKLMTEMWQEAIADDPEAFVMFCFPWGKKGTPLENKKGPRKWQKAKLRAIAQHIRENKDRLKNGQPLEVMQDATASGRGIGKSALTSWLILWAMSCRLGGTVIVTANTEDQIKTKTWAELGIWHTLAINSHWFEKNALSLKPAPWFVTLLKKQLKIDSTYYYAMAQLWREENPDAFAGAHNQNGMLVIFDEASGIPEVIWKVTKGVFTELVLHRYWFTFANPRRNTGAFFECFHAARAFWRRTQIDARTVEDTDQKTYEEIIAQHGEDSDAARVEVRGLFPRQSDNQFISRELVEDAMKREVQRDDYAPLIMGVDVARYGNDETKIRFRQGRDARTIPAITLKQKDSVAVANEVAHQINQKNPDAICIDAGAGAGVIDILRAMGFKVFEIGFGEKAKDEQWANTRTEIWARMRDWLSTGCIDTNPDLKDDLVTPMYKFQGNSDRLMLEPKEEMKRRGYDSPDDADALALTFAVKIPRRDLSAHRNSSNRPTNKKKARGLDYKIFG